ncbi:MULTISPECIES: flagellar biosynthesis protein FliQ [Burkholderia]|jgi:flagellar biosynthetic protein FliQ|uniref:Flagellar biosynthetic protein FliQ n=2 Tax=Burkholderia gladioli TaxID=28095 RepID=A0A095W666_BURGA|nr:MULTISPECIES: flagellar biosynthesis protein FliQ [Burkholderia]AEA58728.1 Flagellar biosynthesis protein FliQ [Burkholderia gladioli BSR3]AJW97620.1 flagellar biosynthetic protein FliQ [Burkholderia gladioli]ASD77565.1 flagellar export apparatus protein FliQ [Burkholderia gladioli pv. gladioli]ATF85984.1 flagellar biosynthetic protein FliQ [Burkholderia gladioli pv. gladioli]AWY53519.1 flagellar export apparatus protein FliQ [Burkholderia gladioli pv. gladioli]
MTPESVMTLGHQAMMIGLLLAAPLLLVALVVGLVVSLFQAATQINESTLSFIPKLLAIVVTMVIAGPWMLSTMLDYMRDILMHVATLGTS